MLLQHHMLGPNKFSLSSDMGFDTNEIAVPRLIWDDSFSSNKGNKGFYSLDVAPLALWAPNGGLNLVTEEVFMMGGLRKEINSEEEDVCWWVWWVFRCNAMRCDDALLLACRGSDWLAVDLIEEELGGAGREDTLS
nr:hypothetical protein CFP56_60813 [Quercus suber]